MHHRVRPLWAVLALAFALFVGLTASAGAASSRATLTGSVPPWATSAAFKSSANGADAVGFRVYLGWRDAAQVVSLAKAVSDPHSASYHQYLSPSQFRQRFSPPAADVNAVRNWLKVSGFTVTYVPDNGLFVAAEGTVAQATAAFGVKFNEYSVQGMTLRSPATNLSVPASLSGIVNGVIGLDQSGALVRPLAVKDSAPMPAGFRNGEPAASTYWGAVTASGSLTPDGVTLPNGQNNAPLPFAPLGYTPVQLQHAYGVSDAIASGNDGSGVTVAIIDAYASPTIVQDVNTYASLHPGFPPLKNGQFTQVVAPGTFNHPETKTQDPSGWWGEETLDVEAVHSMAPGAKIVYAGAPNPQNGSMDAVLNHLIDRHLAQIVSNSYGNAGEQLAPGQIKPLNSIFQQAAVEGIGLYFSSGDNGDEVANLGYRTVDWSASSPWVTAVGGTSLGVGSSNDYQFETGWGTSRSVLSGAVWAPTLPGDYWYGGGGGTSRLFAQPWYQAGVVPATIADYFQTGTAWRAIPDVAMDGDPTTGMLVGQTQTFSDVGVKYGEYRIGGTSLSCPLFAGVMALADQKAGFAHGFANPKLYAASVAQPGAYRDVVDPSSPIAAVRADFVNGENDSAGMNYSVRTMNQTGTLHTIPGYDDVTGIGTPNGATFLDALLKK